MNLPQSTITEHLTAAGGDLSAACRSLSKATGADTITVRQAVCDAQGFRMPARYRCRDVSTGQGRSERGRHR